MRMGGKLVDDTEGKVMGACGISTGTRLRLQLKIFLGIICPDQNELLSRVDCIFSACLPVVVHIHHFVRGYVVMVRGGIDGCLPL